MFYIVKLSVFLLITVPAAIVAIVLGLVDPHGKLSYGVSRLWTALILQMGGVKLKVFGREHIDPSRQYIFIVNHQSNIDIPVLMRSLAKFQLRWLAKRELLWIPLFGWAMWAAKHISVDRADPLAAVKSLQRAKKRLGGGISVVIFPEGTRSRGGELLKFKKGGFLLAVQAKTPLVPVTINGSRHLLPAGAWRLRPGTVEVIIGRPMAVDGFRPGNLRNLVGAVRAEIAKHLRGAGGDSNGAGGAPDTDAARLDNNVLKIGASQESWTR